jgi:hypothetical protein
VSHDGEELLGKGYGFVTDPGRELNYGSPHISQSVLSWPGMQSEKILISDFRTFPDCP